MSGSMISVNDARIVADSTGSLTAAISTNKIYESKYRHMARKREVNVKVISRESNQYLMRHFPLLDKEDVAEMRGADNSYKYVHFGGITVSVEPLMHSLFLKNHGQKIMGICAIIDSMFNNFDESIISLHRFDLSQKRADFICMPDHCLSLTDEHLMKRISVLLIFDHLAVAPGCELFNICVGHVTTCSNTLNPTGGQSNRIRNLPVRGAEEVSYEQVSQELIKSLGNRSNDDDICFMQDGEDTVILKPRGALTRLGLRRPGRSVIRKNYTASSNDKSKLLIMPKLTRTMSDPRRSTDIKVGYSMRDVRDRDEASASSTHIIITDSELKKQIREDRDRRVQQYREFKGDRLRLKKKNDLDISRASDRTKPWGAE
ncbi:TPA_asm: P3 [Pinellia alphacytorhabdovirus 1]|nr:TPA_asm: P3 [Pinellia alphacytorhabdovirus 1]